MSDGNKMCNIILIRVELRWPSCLAKIEGSMTGTKGVISAKVLFNASKVKAEFDENIVKSDELVTKVEKLGYPVQSSKVTLV